MFSLKKDDLYLRLRDDILKGKYPPMTKLPPELEFSMQLGVAKVTLRSALARLEQEGRVARLRGRGTFVLGEQKSNTILVCIPHQSGLELPHNYIYPGMEAGAMEIGYTTELCFNEYIRSLPRKKALELLDSKRFCGVLLIYSCFNGDEAELELFKELGLPVIIVHGVYEDRLTGCGLMHINLRLAWKSGLEHLAAKGHRNVRILHLKGHSTLRGWNPNEIPALFKKIGLSADDRLIYEAGLDDRDIALALDEMLFDGRTPTAIMCFSDFMAIRLMDALKARKFRIPEDIAVMGFCGYPGDEMLETALSTVDFDYNGMGRSAVTLLSKAGTWFHNEKQAPVIELPFKIIERKSTNITRFESLMF